MVQLKIDEIKNKIFTFRGVQVMIDRDLAKLYEIPTKRLNEQVKRNLERFPEEFMFQLTDQEFESLKEQIGNSASDNSLRSQIATLENKESLRGKHRKYLPYAFTEQGVAMLSSVLNSKTAIQINIEIIKSFIALRKFVINNNLVFNRLEKLERDQITNKVKFDKIFNLLENKDIEPKRGIFFDGEFFDSHVFILDLINRAKNEIILIDNYIDFRTLSLFNKKGEEVNLKIYSKNITEELRVDVRKYEKQYGSIDLIEFSKSHDRFLIIDREV